jgi:hypothetical protein
MTTYRITLRLETAFDVKIEYVRDRLLFLLGKSLFEIEKIKKVRP